MAKKNSADQLKVATKVEYIRWLKALKDNDQVNLLLQTICATCIRALELQYFTVETVK